MEKGRDWGLGRSGEGSGSGEEMTDTQRERDVHHECHTFLQLLDRFECAVLLKQQRIRNILGAGDVTSNLVCTQSKVIRIGHTYT